MKEAVIRIGSLIGEVLVIYLSFLFPFLLPFMLFLVCYEIIRHAPSHTSKDKIIHKSFAIYLIFLLPIFLPLVLSLVCYGSISSALSSLPRAVFLFVVFPLLIFCSFIISICSYFIFRKSVDYCGQLLRYFFLVSFILNVIIFSLFVLF